MLYLVWNIEGSRLITKKSDERYWYRQVWWFEGLNAWYENTVRSNERNAQSKLWYGPRLGRIRRRVYGVWEISGNWEEENSTTFTKTINKA